MRRMTFKSDIVRTATLVVAASNATLLERTYADYVCDGVNDEVQIQAAIDALPAGGGHILCSTGTYSFTNRITISDNTTLEFQNGSTINVSDGSTNGLSASANRESLNGDTYISLITNNDHTNGNSNIKIIGAKVDFGQGNGENNNFPTNSYNYAGIWLENCTDCEIIDCRADGVVYDINLNYRAHGILISNCTRCKTINSGANEAGYDGIRIGGDSDDCCVIGGYGTGNNGHAVQICANAPTTQGTAQNCYIEGFVSESASGDEILIHGSKDGESGGRYSHGHSVVRCKARAIRILEQVSETVIDGNSCVWVEAYQNGTGAKMANLAFVNNKLSGEGTNYTVLIRAANSGSGSIENIVVANNTVIDKRMYIWADSSSAADIKNIRLANNTFRKKAADYMTGAVVIQNDQSSNDIEDITIDGNEIVIGDNANDYCIRLIIKGDANINRVYAVNNRFYGYNFIRPERTSGTGMISYIYAAGNVGTAISIVVRCDATNYTDYIYLKDNIIENCDWVYRYGANYYIDYNWFKSIDTAEAAQAATSVEKVGNRGLT